MAGNVDATQGLINDLNASNAKLQAVLDQVLAVLNGILEPLLSLKLHSVVV